MEIASLGTEHQDAVVALWESAGLTRPWNPPAEDFRRAIDGPSSQVLGLFDDGTLVGTVMVGHDGHRGWVYYLAVDPEHRGSGTGRALMSAAELALREAGVPKVLLMVRRSNEEATGFYEHLGYERDDVDVFARWLPDR